MTRKQPQPQQIYSGTLPARSDDGIEVRYNIIIHLTQAACLMISNRTTQATDVRCDGVGLPLLPDL